MRAGLQVGFGALFLVCLLLAIFFQQGIFLALPYTVLFLFASLYHPKAAWFLLIVTLPLSTEIVFNDMLGTDMPDEPIMIWLTALFGLLLLSGQLKGTQNLLKSPVLFFIILLLAWSCFSAVFSTSPLVSVKYILAKTWYIVPFMVLPYFFIEEKKEIKWLVIALLAPMGLAVVYVLFRHGQQGFLFDNANHVVKPFFRNHVNYAAMLVCLVPVLYFAAGMVKPKRMALFLYGLLLLFLLALFFSFSRGAWLALGTGIIAAVLIRLKWLPQVFLLSLGVMLVTVLWFSSNNRYLSYHHNFKKTIYHANLADHMQATFRNTDLSNAERVYRWVAAVRMSAERPVIGFGPGTFYDNYKPYGVSYFKTWVSENPERSTVHNYFLLLLTEQGIPALLLFCGLLYLLLYRVQRLYHDFSDPLYRKTALCTGIMLVMILTVNMLSDLIETDKIGSLFYLCCGMVIVLERLSSSDISRLKT